MEELTDEVVELSRGHQIAKLVIGALVAYAAKELVDVGYDRLVASRNTPADTEQE